MKLSLETYQDINKQKAWRVHKQNEQNSQNMDRKSQHRMPWNEGKTTRLRNRSRRDSLKFVGISEYGNKIWADTKYILKDILRERG